MFDLNDIVRGYNDEQYTRACCDIILNYLTEKNIIDLKEVQKYFKENFKKHLEDIVEGDKKEIKERLEKYKQN